MGIRIGIGRLIIGQGSGSRAWTQQKIAESFEMFVYNNRASGGQIRNEADNGATYMTYTGSGLNRVYAVPNNATYKGLDTDYCWFKNNGDVSSCDGNRLIVYDFSKTIVKYQDVSPYAIEWIAIPKAGVSVSDIMRDTFHLSMWWDGTFNSFGVSKGNRTIGRSVWIPEVTTPATISDTSKSLGWFDDQDLANITKDAGTGEVSVWNDKNGTGVNYGDPGATKRPIWTVGGITFDGVNDFLETGAIAINQPLMMYLVCKNISWRNLGVIVKFGSYGKPMLWQNGSTPSIKASGDESTWSNACNDLVQGQLSIIRMVFNGASSKLQVNNNAPLTGSWGTGNANKLRLAAYSSTLYFSNLLVKEHIYRKVVDSGGDETAIYNYLANKNGLPTI